MSTEANIAIVQKAYADFKAGNIPSLLASLADDVEWITPGQSLPMAGKRRGKAQVAQFFEIVNQTWDFKSFEPRQYIASGDTVACVGNYSFLSRATGKAATADWVMVFQFRGGKVASFQEFTDTLAAAEALRPHAATA